MIKDSRVLVSSRIGLWAGGADTSENLAANGPSVTRRVLTAEIVISNPVSRDQGQQRP